ncbi:uncharacterized protein FTOL_11564 [Fusarium torulosum]|uniref:Uncharacterized protein n=1 Tax=Fusarium torulosum TaxID=33205 RepID=A0AAE8SNK4_9HYPO|nr:uncharacterized protein FTOL_11564 [Fusarium torulosum]
MAVPELSDVLRFEAYKGEDSDSAFIEISWSQALRSRSATYYILDAKNTSKGNADTILYIQKPIYMDESSPDFLSKVPGATKEGDDWVVSITDRFQYGQKNAQGEQRFLVLQDKANKMYQKHWVSNTSPFYGPVQTFR